jgi:hypothetical protein
MALHVYTAWLRNLAARPDDQDYEFPACFLIDSDTPEAAQAWGDHLALRRCSRGDLHFLWSEAEFAEVPPDLPLVRDGQDAPDSHIGW